jgi:hypothetical protein
MTTQRKTAKTAPQRTTAPAAPADQDQAPEAQASQEQEDQEPGAGACRVVFSLDPVTGKILMDSEGCTDEQVDQIAEQVATGDYYAYQGCDPDQVTLRLGDEDEVEPEFDTDEDDEPEDE